MINRKPDDYWYHHLTNDEEFIYFYVKLMNKYQLPIRRLIEESRLKILNIENRIYDDFAIMKNHCSMYNLEWKEYNIPITSEIGGNGEA